MLLLLAPSRWSRTKKPLAVLLPKSCMSLPSESEFECIAALRCAHALLSGAMSWHKRSGAMRAVCAAWVCIVLLPYACRAQLALAACAASKLCMVAAAAKTPVLLDLHADDTCELTYTALVCAFPAVFQSHKGATPKNCYLAVCMQDQMNPYTPSLGLVDGACGYGALASDQCASGAAKQLTITDVLSAAVGTDAIVRGLYVGRI